MRKGCRNNGHRRPTKVRRQRTRFRVKCTRSSIKPQGNCLAVQMQEWMRAFSGNYRKDRANLALVEFSAGCSLHKAHAPGDDFRLEIVFAFDGTTRKAAEHGDLADVRQRVRDRALKEAVG